MQKVVSFQSSFDERRRNSLLADLPPTGTERWVASRKAKVVVAVNAGALSAQEACERYGLSEEELTIWLEAHDQHGASALLVTKMQRFRTPDDGRDARTIPA